MSEWVTWLFTVINLQWRTRERVCEARALQKNPGQKWKISFNSEPVDTLQK